MKSVNHSAECQLRLIVLFVNTQGQSNPSGDAVDDAESGGALPGDVDGISREPVSEALSEVLLLPGNLRGIVAALHLSLTSGAAGL